MRSNKPMRRIPFSELQSTIERAMLNLGLTPERAALSARLTAETDRDGVRTHGIARVPRFAEMVRLGSVNPYATPELVSSFGAIERWTGNRGPGNLAAYAAMNRAIELARLHGLGAVALADTTHWQRAGTFGWQAADAGLAAMCWTNTLPNLPPWGATTPALGNNPLVLAIPHQHSPIVLDMAMSQFSYGTLAAYRERGDQLPVPGGYDESGVLTTDPAAIERTTRPLPIGFWKGSGLSFALDVLAAMLSGGRTAHQIPTDPLQEVGLSQIFLAISPTSLGTIAELNAIATGAIDALHAASPITPNRPARYPGEGTLTTRKESLNLGVPVDETHWQRILDLAN
jgi:3-dehydro-L-gulonate 2-dehydrogenase